MSEHSYDDTNSASAVDPTAGDETVADQSEASAARPAVEPDAALAELQREKQALQERLLRTAAEFDNYRKRMDRERRELSEFAATDVLLDLLPIVDNFERALQAPGGGGELEAFRKGIELIHKQMLDLLRKRNVTTIDALGADFDPRFHQAVIHEDSDEHREGEVMQELQRGYMIGERLLRPAMVKVAKRP